MTVSTPTTKLLRPSNQSGSDKVTMLFLALLSAAIVVVLYIRRFATSANGRPSLPPGLPRRFFGFLKTDLGMPAWKALSLLHERYGPVTSMYQGRKLIISLGTLKAATDLLEKRGNIYSSRPRNIMGSELMSGGMRGVNMPYGVKWRNWRTLMHAGLGIQATGGHEKMQSLESKILLNDLLNEKDPMAYATHIRRTLASISMTMAYGRRVEYFGDPVVQAQLHSEHAFVHYSQPGKFLVESWPILLKLPRFLQWFRRVPEAHRKIDTKVYMELLSEAKEKLEKGETETVILRKALDKQTEYGLSDVELAFGLSAPFAAGVSTSSTTLEIFILAMLHHPHIMRKAQEDIDSVVGPLRLPEFEDLDSLPYITAIIKETLRWRPLFPLGIPHDSLADDVYEGFFIPAGSSVVWNAYLISRDEKLFPAPDEFRPERYLGSAKEGSPSEELDPSFVFGFGRRICPGMHIARKSLFIMITRLLWAFDIIPSKDSDGNAVLPPIAFEDFVEALAIRPRPFSYILQPRKGDQGHSLITQECKRAREELEMRG